MEKSPIESLLKEKQIVLIPNGQLLICKVIIMNSD